MRMKLALAFALLLTGATAASAADNWVGAWGYVPTAQPPGQSPPPATTPAAAGAPPAGRRWRARTPT